MVFVLSSIDRLAIGALVLKLWYLHSNTSTAKEIGDRNQHGLSPRPLLFTTKRGNGRINELLSLFRWDLTQMDG